MKKSGHKSLPPLHAACSAGDVSEVNRLLNARADPNACDHHKRTPCDVLCGTYRSYDNYWHRGPLSPTDVGQLPIWQKPQHGVCDAVKIIQLLLIAGTDPYAFHTDSYESLPHRVCYNAIFLETLYNAGVDLNVTTHENYAPIHFVCFDSRGPYESLTTLIAADVDIDVSPPVGSTPFSPEPCLYEPFREALAGYSRRIATTLVPGPTSSATGDLGIPAAAAREILTWSFGGIYGTCAPIRSSRIARRRA